MLMLLSRAGFEAENIDDFKGLNKRSPWYALMMLMLMFSMAGHAAFIGFFAKLVGAAGGGRGGLLLAGGAGGGDVADRRVLLPARGQGDVLRRAASPIPARC
jgi:hypothetical protein